MNKDEALKLALEALEYTGLKWPQVEEAITAVKAALEAKDEPVACWCHKCNENELVNGIPFAMTRMILCPKCGNKRCPKASDHTLQCTNSNEPNQAGSVYTTPPPVAEPHKRTWVGLTDEHKEGLICMTDPNPEPHHLRELIDVVEFQLKEKNT